MKSIKDEFKKKGIFYTPPELANFLLKYVDFKPRDVYDPTCGDGGLLSAFEDDVIKYGQEINQDQLEVAQERLKNFTGVCGDTLENPAFLDKKFHLIMGNPPFSIKWTPHTDDRFQGVPALPPPSKADYAFLLHIIHYLADDGKAVVLNFPGILYRGNKEGKIRQWIVENNYIERVVAIPNKQFEDTTIATALLVLSKCKKTTDIVFEDVEHGLERIVPIEEIRQENFNLSVSTYVQPEETKEPFDAPLQQELARNNFKKKLKSELDFDSMVCQMEGWNNKQYLLELKEIIDNFILREAEHGSTEGKEEEKE